MKNKITAAFAFMLVLLSAAFVHSCSSSNDNDGTAPTNTTSDTIPNLFGHLNISAKSETTTDLIAKTTALYKLKQFYIFNPNLRAKIQVPNNLFTSPKIKAAVLDFFSRRYKSDNTSKPVQILINEIVTLNDGTTVVPTIEPVAPIEMLHIDKYNNWKFFYLFKKINNIYVLSDIKQVNFFKRQIDTKYSYNNNETISCLIIKNEERNDQSR
jgi:hypothetical protein